MSGSLDTARAANDEKTIDRRTRYTLKVIHDAFFGLLRKKDFAKLTVSDLCKQAEINRGTFYLHYEDKNALLNAVIDEALDAEPMIDGSPATMRQRPPANDDYRLLYQDPTTFPLVVARIIERGAAEGVPSIMEETGFGEEDARVLFAYMAHGNLAVNRMLDWKNGKAFNKAQALVSSFAQAGMKGASESR